MTVAACSIESVQSLFTLPQPLDSERGRTVTGSAHGISNWRKRKRSEIVVGVDGDSLNVYNVRSSRLVISHALPPQAYLTAAPCSVFRKTTLERMPRRTYAAIRNELTQEGSKICCFTSASESGTSTPSLNTKRSLNSSINLGTRENPVVHLDILPLRPSSDSNTDSSYNVLALQERGEITCLSEDLSFKRWTTALKSLQSNTALEDTREHFVEFATTVSFEKACEGFLNGKDEITAALDPQRLNQQLLCVVSRSADASTSSNFDRAFSLFSIQLENSKSLATPSPTVRQLLKLTLTQPPFAQSAESGSPLFAFDLTTGLLQQTNNRTLAVYDLNSSTSKIISEITEQHHLSSSLILSPSLSIVSTENYCSIYNIHYQSRQASLNFLQSTSSDQSRKRKRSRSELQLKGLRFEQYFSNLQLAVGIAGCHLVGVQLLTDRSKQNSKRRKTGRLIDSLGRGVGTVKDGQALNTTRLDNLARAKNIKGFERCFFRSLAGQKDEKEIKPDKSYVPQEDSGLEDEFPPRALLDVAVEQDASGIEDTSKAFRGDQCRQQLARCALAKIFTSNQEFQPSSNPGYNKNTSLKITFFPPKVFGWLARHGFVTIEEIRSAFVQDSGTFHLIDRIQSTDLVNALTNHDSSLILLSKLILCEGHLDLSGTIESIKILMESFDRQKTLDMDRLLTNGEDITVEEQYTNGEDLTNGVLDEYVQAEEDAAVEELDLAISSLENGASIRGDALRFCLARVPISFSARQIVQALKAQLSFRELVLLIDLLRYELAEGGWTTRYVDIDPARPSPPPSHDNAISHICNLLNCTLDALGTSGWLSGSALPDEDEADSLVTFLRAETSATLQGIQESSFFKGFLKDFFRYERLVNQTSAEGKATSHVLTSTSSDRPDVTLPVGLQSVRGISNTRVGAGGEIQKRSLRDIGAKEQRKVGKYTFERLRI